ncbi:hypothetical protein TTHERM_000059498 (macronuclear) [Tetrahymena thermophila SB210]|uniref:Uncharacterized protein n=1 Tax=Tetrahymena thermophila (strain SB210) TaxID=312017 RepID=W7XFA5_TETTS|nr:hypothetical protein TTHERM_000059498 [Tetrahymena thermophila SB210]EWS76487.1 hypothetical protein TTHERM_000059498 [Tetrahymena thermophila SB210]|eukprot:XP_012650977.1 hypothetical protein TTHERM_000059498 [Tetrahymena thermophila SB210]
MINTLKMSKSIIHIFQMSQNTQQDHNHLHIKHHLKSKELHKKGNFNLGLLHMYYKLHFCRANKKEDYQLCNSLDYINLHIIHQINKNYFSTMSKLRMYINHNLLFQQNKVYKYYQLDSIKNHNQVDIQSLTDSNYYHTFSISQDLISIISNQDQYSQYTSMYSNSIITLEDNYLNTIFDLQINMNLTHIHHMMNYYYILHIYSNMDHIFDQFCFKMYNQGNQQGKYYYINMCHLDKISTCYYLRNRTINKKYQSKGHKQIHSNIIILDKHISQSYLEQLLHCNLNSYFKLYNHCIQTSNQHIQEEYLQNLHNILMDMDYNTSHFKGSNCLSKQCMLRMYIQSNQEQAKSKVNKYYLLANKKNHNLFYTQILVNYKDFDIEYINLYHFNIVSNQDLHIQYINYYLNFITIQQGNYLNNFFHQFIDKCFAYKYHKKNYQNILSNSKCKDHNIMFDRLGNIIWDKLEHNYYQQSKCLLGKLNIYYYQLYHKFSKMYFDKQHNQNFTNIICLGKRINFESQEKLLHSKINKYLKMHKFSKLINMVNMQSQKDNNHSYIKYIYFMSTLNIRCKKLKYTMIEYQNYIKFLKLNYFKNIINKKQIINLSIYTESKN